MMSQQLQTATLPLGRLHQFVIRDPKERVITAPCFEERVLHGVPHDRSYELLARRFKDERLLDLLERIIRSSGARPDAGCRLGV